MNPAATYGLSFTEEALKALQGDGWTLGQGYPGGAQLAVPDGPPAVGDVFIDRRLSQRVFVVQRRAFVWDESGALVILLHLDLDPNADAPVKTQGHGVVVELRPKTGEQSGEHGSAEP